MRRECQESFPATDFKKKPLVSDPDMHHGTHVPWCMSGSLTGGGGENVSGIPGACATCNFTYLVRDPMRVESALWAKIHTIQNGQEVLVISATFPMQSQHE